MVGVDRVNSLLRRIDTRRHQHQLYSYSGWAAHAQLSTSQIRSRFEYLITENILALLRQSI